MDWHWYTILAAFLIVAGTVRWLAWLIFNAWVFSKTNDLSAFNKTAPVAKSFRRLLGDLPPIKLGKAEPSDTSAADHRAVESENVSSQN